MPKYTLDEVIDIIKTSLTSEEQSQLQAKLPSILGVSTNISDTSKGGQTQTQTFGNVTIGGSGSGFSANQATGNISNTQNNTQTQLENADLQNALQWIGQIKQGIASTNALNSIEKATLGGTVTGLEEEVKKPEPNKSLVEQAIAVLNQGLAGVQELAEPTMKVAALVAKAWML